MSDFDDPRELAAWLRNDAAKICNQPGMNGVVERIRLAARMLDQKEAENND